MMISLAITFLWWDYTDHYSYFPLRYKNIDKYPKQGWENVDGIMKKTFHTKTQKEGDGGDTSKLLPVFKSVRRGLLWKVG